MLKLVSNSENEEKENPIDAAPKVPNDQLIFKKSIDEINEYT